MVVRAVFAEEEGTYVFCQISSPLELPHGQEAVDLAARVGALGTDLFVLDWAFTHIKGSHTERRKVRMIFQNMYRRSAVLA